MPVILFILQQYISRALEPPSLPVLSRLCRSDCDMIIDEGGRHGWAGCNNVLRDELHVASMLSDIYIYILYHIILYIMTKLASLLFKHG